MNTNSANSAYEKNEKTVDKYIKAIKKEFPIYRKGEKRYLKMLRSSMYDYAVSFEGELITVSHLSKKFGSPKDCANTYIEYLGTDTICHNMNGKKYGKYIFITALSVILGFAICISVMLYKEWQISRRTDIASTTIIIQDGVAPNDLSEYTWAGSSDGDVPLTNNTETPNDNTNNNTDTEE